METFDARKMPTPLLATTSMISNIIFSIIGGFWIYAWLELNKPDNNIALYGIIILSTCYITLIIVSYVILKWVFNKYIYTLHLRTLIQCQNMV